MTGNHVQHVNVLKPQLGFTLVELITVIILLGIMSIAVVPRFMGSSGYSEYAVQKRLLSALRNIQLKSMHDTRSDYCYKLIFDTSTNPEFGPPTASFLSGQQSASCGNTIDYTSSSYLRSDLGELANDKLLLQVNDGASSATFIQFTNSGTPLTDVGTCSSGCEISVIGEDAAKICVASEGYVYAC
jgi:MSHA pilin protein MshC